MLKIMSYRIFTFMKEQEIICTSSLCFVLQKQIEVVSMSKWYLFVFQIV